MSAEGALRPTALLPRPLLLLAMCAFCCYLSYLLLVAALPLYFTEVLHFSNSQVGVAIGFGYAATILAYAVVGVAADRGAAGRFIVGSAAAVTAAGPLFLVSRSVWLVSAVTLVQGVTMSAFVIACTATAGQLAEPERRGAQIGMYSVFGQVAAAAAPAAGIFLFRGWGAWPLFAASCGAGLVAVLLGLVLGRVVPAPSRRVVSFASWIRGVGGTLLPAGSVLAMGLPFGVVAAFMPVLVTGHGVRNAGLFYTAQVVAQLALRAAAGALSDRIGRAPVAGFGLTLIGLAALLLPLVGSDGVLVAVGLISGSGFAIFSPSLLAWLFDRSASERRGLASAVFLTAQDVGRAGGSIGLESAIGGLAATFVTAGSIAAVCGLGLLGFGVSGLGLRRRREVRGP